MYIYAYIGDATRDLGCSWNCYVYNTSGTSAQARSEILISNILSTTMLSARGGVGRTEGRRDGRTDGQLKGYEL